MPTQENKTKPGKSSVAAFIAAQPEPRRTDCTTLLKLVEDAVGEKAVLWGESIVGAGKYHYKYPSGRQGDWFFAGFSPRKQNLTVYVISGFNGMESLLAKLGKYKTSAGSCLYVNTLADIDTGFLKQILNNCVARMRATYPASA